MVSSRELSPSITSVTSGHTPGPWTSETCPCGWSLCRGIFSSCEKIAESVLEPNANLIAASPDLLEALMALLSDLSPAAQLSNAGQLARAAISKATGQ